MAEAKHGVEISLHIGQRVRLRDHAGVRVTGVVHGLALEPDRGIVARVLLDAPIVIPARGEGDREIDIHWQNVEVHELAPFDERDEQIAEMLVALQTLVSAIGDDHLGGIDHSCDLCSAFALAQNAISKITGATT